MNQKIRTEEFERIKVSAFLVNKNGVAFPFEKDGSQTHTKYKIAIEVGSGKAEFDYYGSTDNFAKRKFSLSKYDLLTAFSSILQDAQGSYDSFEDFCANFGYESDSRRAETIYKKCAEGKDKLFMLGIGELEICALAEKLQKAGFE